MKKFTLTLLSSAILATSGFAIAETTPLANTKAVHGMDLTQQTKDFADISLIVKQMGTLADSNDYAALGKIFADKVKVDYTALFGGEVTQPTRDELMAQWAAFLPGFDRTYHDLSNIRIEQKGDKATVLADVTASHYLGKDGFWQVSGVYTYEMTKNKNGNWQINALTIKPTGEKGSCDVLAKGAENAKGKVFLTNQKAVKDAAEINNKDLWPKPKNPVAPGSENSEALKVVQGFFEAYGKHDMEGIKKFVTDDVEWHIPGHHQLAGTKRGIKEFTEFFDSLGKAGFGAEVMILAANDTYVIDAHRGWSTKGKDGNIDLNWVLLYQIKDGKIQRVQNFSGDLYQSDKFFNKFSAQ